MSDGMQLDLKKPLDKMTAKELRDLVLKQIPQITGASGLGKEELLVQIKEAGGSGFDEGKHTLHHRTEARRNRLLCDQGGRVLPNLFAV